MEKTRQRRSQVSLAGGGADRIPGGGGIHLNTYSYGKRDNAAWGAQIFPGGDEPPLSPPPRGYGPGTRGIQQNILNSFIIIIIG